MDTTDFGGLAAGDEPARPILVNYGGALDRRRAAVPLSRSDQPGWLAIKTLWYVTPSYPGPVVIRAQRLDGPGVIRMGGTPLPGPLIIQPGTDANASGGYRTSPGGTWVRTAGCYGWQVDGATFSHVIVVQATAPLSPVP